MALVIAVILLVPWYLGGAASAVISYRLLSSPPQAPAASPVVHAPVSTPTRRPTVVATPAPATPMASSGPSLTELPALVERARESMAKGNLDGAIERLDRAAAISADHPVVMETAQQIVDLLLQEARTYAQLTRWRMVRRDKDAALELSRRFGLPEEDLVAECNRLEQTIKSHFFPADRLPELTTMVGREAKVIPDDGPQLHGIIRGVENNTLLLDVIDDVGQGKVFFAHQVALDRIHHVNVIPR
jgi:hypothetical protein